MQRFGLLLVIGLWAAGTPARAPQRDGLLIWEDPGGVETLDFANGPGGVALKPQPPFTYIERIRDGATKKAKVRDLAGRIWVAKWGDEARAEIIASRIAWGCGYFVIPSYFVTSGRIAGAEKLGDYIEHDGSFRNARFQLWDETLLEDTSWSWSGNYFDTDFPGLRELNGLKVVMMLTSNWDTKDARDRDIGCNTAIRKTTAGGMSRLEHLVLDWGGSMGRWGGYFSHNKWDCEGFAEESPRFVAGIESGKIRWGYGASMHTGDITEGIRVEDVKWLMQFLGRMTDDQLRAALASGGATPHEVDCYTRSLRSRIEQLRTIASPAASQARATPAR